MVKATITITDPGLKHAILAHLIHQIDHGGIDDLLGCGLGPTFIDEIRRRPSRDLNYVASNMQIQFETRIDPMGIMGCFTRIDDSRKAEALKEYFIANGASATLLRDMFHVSKAEVFSLRQLLDSKAPNHTGRTRMPTESERELIHAAWAQIQSEFNREPAREQLFRLHQRFENHSLSSLWATIDEFNKLAAPNPY